MVVLVHPDLPGQPIDVEEISAVEHYLPHTKWRRKSTSKAKASKAEPPVPTNPEKG